MAEAPPSFFCPITYELMVDPVTTEDGHSYERVAIEHWLRDNGTSPKTGAELQSTALTVAHSLRNAIEEWQQANCKLIPRNALTFRDPQDQIGAGSFKRVFKAVLRLPGSPRATTVAALRVRDGDVAAEAATLLKLGKHPRLVTFLGQCKSTEAPGGDVILITEFAPMGSLDSVIEDVEDDITMGHKITIMTQVAAGMEALAAQRLIHRDLALRNVLVFALDVDDVRATSVKVSDFGLTVNAYTATHKYVQGGALPVRYLAPESLEKGRYSEGSDVWAFGVMCWELLTHGMIPYCEISADDNVIAHVRSGGRLSRPTDDYECPDRVWEIVASCWVKKPKDRPPFAELGISFGMNLVDVTSPVPVRASAPPLAKVPRAAAPATGLRDSDPVDLTPAPSRAQIEHNFEALGLGKQIDSDGILDLSSNAKLKQLMAEQSESDFWKTVQTVMHYCNAARCKVLDLGSNNLGQVGGTAVAKALETNTSLQKLNLGSTLLGEVGGTAVAKALETNTSLQNLGLGWNNLGEVFGTAFAKALETNTSLKELNLKSNNLGEQTGVALGKALETNTSLKELHLRDNGLGEQTGVALGKALETNTSLKELNLWANNLGEVGGTAVAKALETNTSLQKLNLRNNGLGEQTGVALGKALETNTCLRTLNLAGNNLGEQTGIALGKALETNASLQNLNLQYNKLDASESAIKGAWGNRSNNLFF